MLTFVRTGWHGKMGRAVFGLRCRAWLGVEWLIDVGKEPK